jgi:hypothetical protein
MAHSRAWRERVEPSTPTMIPGIFFSLGSACLYTIDARRAAGPKSGPKVPVLALLPPV